MGKRVINMLPVLAYGDAVGNDAVAMHRSLADNGYDSILCAAAHDARIKDKVISSDDIDPKEDDIIIYHLSTGHELNKQFKKMPGKKIIRYHNITPPEYFYGYNRMALSNCVMGYKEMYSLNRSADYILADSEYNLSDLRNAGYEAPGEALPILIPFSDYEKEPDEETLNKMKDGRTNILFTGRIVPNKRQEQVIRAFYHYKKKFDEDARLIFVGNPGGMELYYDSLVDYANGLGIGEDVIFPGHIPFSAILSYYRSADLFLCMSDHEGFCVPLVESMFFDVPIVAKDTTAIPYTLGGAGVLLKDDDPIAAAEEMNRILSDDKVKEEIIKGQRERLDFFDHDRIEKRFLEVVGGIK